MDIRYCICDHCHKTIDEMHDYSDYLIDLPSGDYRHVDLCKDCALELQILVGQFIGRVDSNGEEIADEKGIKF